MQSTAQGKSGGWKKKIAFGGSKARGASSLDETTSSGPTATPGGGGGGGGGGEKQTQEQMEPTIEKQLSEPVFTKIHVSTRLFFYGSPLVTLLGSSPFFNCLCNIEGWEEATSLVC